MFVWFVYLSHVIDHRWPSYKCENIGELNEAKTKASLSIGGSGKVKL